MVRLTFGVVDYQINGNESRKLEPFSDICLCFRALARLLRCSAKSSERSSIRDSNVIPQLARAFVFGFAHLRDFERNCKTTAMTSDANHGSCLQKMMVCFGEVDRQISLVSTPIVCGMHLVSIVQRRNDTATERN
jgi:hypothetical protein